MKNISLFLDFDRLSHPVVEWFSAITSTTKGQPIFCNISSKSGSCEMSLSKVSKNKTSLEFDEMLSRKYHLPENLVNSFGSEDFPIFNIDEVTQSDNLLREILDTELVVISCAPFNKTSGIHVNSLLSKIINTSKCPVLLIPDNISYPETFSKLVFASDLRFTELRMTKEFAKIASCLNMSLVFAHVSDSGIPDINIDFGKALFNDTLKRRITHQEFSLEVLKRLDVQKYPDLIHDYLMGDIYAFVNKRSCLHESDSITHAAVDFTIKSKKPVLICNN